MGLFDDLKANAALDWEHYTRHPFVQQLAEETLPVEAFQQFMTQDYLFLLHFSRAYALAGYKSTTVTDMTKAQQGFTAALEESQLHIGVCQQWGISAKDLGQVAEHPATVAYTRFVLDTGLRGDLLDLHVALAPCAVGYAEIGAWLKPAIHGRDDHRYQEWITEYSGDEFQALAGDSIDYLDELDARLGSPARRKSLTQIFATATRMESAFWQMGLDVVER